MDTIISIAAIALVLVIFAVGYDIGREVEKRKWEKIMNEE